MCNCGVEAEGSAELAGGAGYYFGAAVGQLHELRRRQVCHCGARRRRPLIFRPAKRIEFGSLRRVPRKVKTVPAK